MLHPLFTTAKTLVFRTKSSMLTILESSVMEALRTVKYPGYSRDIVSFGLVKGVQIDGSAVGVLLELTTPNPEIGNQIADAAKAALRDRSRGSLTPMCRSRYRRRPRRFRLLRPIPGLLSEIACPEFVGWLRWLRAREG